LAADWVGRRTERSIMYSRRGDRASARVCDECCLGRNRTDHSVLEFARICAGDLVSPLRPIGQVSKLRYHVDVAQGPPPGPLSCLRLRGRASDPLRLLSAAWPKTARDRYATVGT